MREVSSGEVTRGKDLFTEMEEALITRRTFIKGLLIGAFITALPFGRGLVAARSAGKAARTAEGSRPMVLRVKAPLVSKQGFEAARYLDSIDRARLSETLKAGLLRFTRRKNIKEAWLKLLTGYRPGQSIAIKPNFNFINHGYRYTVTAPELIDAVVGQLVEEVKVSSANIYVYDLCKIIPRALVRRRIKHPVNYVERIDTSSFIGKVRLRMGYGLASADRGAPIEMREEIVDSAGVKVTCYMPGVLTQADHLITMPLLTNHIFQCNSGALKGHYGTVRFSNRHSYPEVLHGSVMKKSITDINKNTHISGKTRVIISDAIFGVFDRGEGEGKKAWKTFNGFPESILISKDPVAMDSVLASMVIRERKRRGLSTLSHDYLFDAEAKGLGRAEVRSRDLSFKKIEYKEVSFS